MKKKRIGPIEALELQLQALRREGDQLREHAAVVLGQLVELTPQASAAAGRAMDDATKRLSEQAQRETGPLWLSWESPQWAHYGQSRTGVMTHVRTGTLRDEELLPQEGQRADLAAFVPLFAGSGPLVVLGDLRTRDLARSVMRSLVLRVALGMPADTRFTLIDTLGLGAAFPFRGDLAGRVRPSGHTMADELGEVIEDIRRVNERVLGAAARFAELPSEQRAGESFELIAVADFPKACVKDPRAVELLVRIARAGTRAGRHLLLEVNLDASMPHGFQMSELEPAVFIDVRTGVPGAGGEIELDVPPPPARQQELLQIAARLAIRQQRADWGRAVCPQVLLTQSAAERIETPIGERLRFWLGVDSDGSQGAHAIIAGQTGSGKTQLLHVLITGLAARYGPQELQLLLVGGRSSVELAAYRRLPQAELICVRTQPAMARSVLADCVAEMEERYELLQQAGAADLQEYRARSGRPLPRKLLIIEEYPQLFEGDEERGAALLMRILEKGRAAGMHVVLVSNAFSARGLPPGALIDISMRVALLLPPDQSQGLALLGAEGRRLIRDLSAPGQVVLNDKSGRDGASHAGAVAQLDSGSVPEIVQEIARHMTGPAQAPVVLDGRDAAVVTDNPFVRRWIGGPPAPAALEALARAPVRRGGLGQPAWSAADHPVGLWLGRRFDAQGHALAVLRRAPGENLLVLGQQRDVRNRMLAAALAALPSFATPTSVEITLLDGLGHDLPGGRMLLFACEQLAAQGARLVVGREGTLEAPLAALAGSLSPGAEGARTRLLVIAEPETLSFLHQHPESFAPPATGPAAHLRAVLSRGPQQGLHVIVTTSGLAALGTVLSPARDLRHFNHRVVQPLSEEDSMTILSSLAAARMGAQADHPFAALLADPAQGARAGVLLSSYAASTDVHAPQDLATLRACLSALAGKPAAHVA
jgi:hypothetical protein